ncbi:MAG: RNA 2',3'-cyclic phosphodiesterase [Desulfosporosinus sp.]|nr:RNA 2',3'-cyclic phosphodiesterase [Desulfosporosinus sp.]
MRLFVGVDLPADIKHTLLIFQSELKHFGVDGFWKSVDNFHITLEFLGELDFDKISVFKEILTKVASNYKPFGLIIAGLGAFPSLKQPHTLWTTVSGNLSELNRLRQDLHYQLKSKGFKLDERQFKPHITLASRPKLGKVDLSVVQTKILGEFMVAEVVLFESRAISGKRVYTDIYRAGFEIAGECR